MRFRSFALAAAFSALLYSVGPPQARAVHAQGSTTIHGPITALSSDPTGNTSSAGQDGQRLLIGQGSTLIEARILADDLQVIRATDLNRHDIRAVATFDDLIVVLSEDGLTTLDRDGQLLDYLQGGGQQIAVEQGRVYVAALGAGVRVAGLSASGKLSLLGTFQTPGAASDLALATPATLWIAEGDAGLQLVDLRNPAVPSVIQSVSNVATTLRMAGTRLYVAHDSRLSIFETEPSTSLKAPSLLGMFDVPGATIGDLWIVGNRAYVGRIGLDGADVLALDVSDPGAINIVSQFGNNGAGERIVISPGASDVFVGSWRYGLHRWREDNDHPAVLINAWPPGATATSCVLASPTNVDPPNNGSISDSTVTLRWQFACVPAAVELRVNGNPVAALEHGSYSFRPHAGITSWQVTAIDATGKRVDGPLWTFDVVADGWLATPPDAPQPDILYLPPPLLSDSRGSVLAVMAGLIVFGLLVRIVVSRLLARIADRRRGG